MSRRAEPYWTWTMCTGIVAAFGAASLGLVTLVPETPHHPTGAPAPLAPAKPLATVPVQPETLAEAAKASAPALRSVRLSMSGAGLINQPPVLIPKAAQPAAPPALSSPAQPAAQAPAQHAAQPAAPPAAPAAPSPSVGQRALAVARKALGARYQWGGSGPKGFDCSGLMLWSFRQAGITLPRTSRAQSKVGRPVSKDQLQPGDLVFFYSPVSHVGIYVGDGKVLHAPESGDVVKISPMNRMPFHSARRL